ncbi:MAG: hypothetical protein HN341_01365 [Verrucomicrobia bacterium]|nr:hypothetical protein [Verrucomicrobiota bacterium]
MNKRRPIQDKHEQFLIDEFIRWWSSRTGETFQVVSRPDPPEAIVRSDCRTTWIEVTDAFHSPEWAADLYSHAAPDEEHRPMGPGPYVGMDEQTAARFAALLKIKLSKQSYAEAHTQYGRGILLVGMQSPWFDGETCEMMRAVCNKTDWSTDQGYFSHVFISFRSLNRQEFEEWKWDAPQDAWRATK